MEVEFCILELTGQPCSDVAFITQSEIEVCSIGKNHGIEKTFSCIQAFRFEYNYRE